MRKGEGTWKLDTRVKGNDNENTGILRIIKFSISDNAIQAF